MYLSAFSLAQLIFLSVSVCGRRKECRVLEHGGGRLSHIQLKIIIMSQQNCINVVSSSMAVERENTKQMYHMLLCLFSIIKPWGTQKCIIH